MNQYPIATFDKEDWNKKVNACLMYTIPSEDQALPILCQIQQILSRLHTLPLAQTLGQQSVQYFFTQVFPVVCQKIIKSRYFKNQTVLKKANQIIQHTLCLLPKYIELLDKIPQLIEFIHSCLPEQFYFKTNNQLDYKDQPYLYFQKEQNLWENYLEVGSQVDVIRFSQISGDKFYWTHGQIKQINQADYVVSYMKDFEFSQKVIPKNSYLLAPFGSRSKTFEWRSTLKAGDLLDVMDSFGGWYNATVIGVEEEDDGRRKVQVTIKVYNQNGNKTDEQGKYFGFADYKEKYDAFSADIAPYCSVAKEFCYESSKSQFDVIDDLNDMQLTQFNGKRVYALPRKKHLSDTIFKALNRFGSLGGFQQTLKKIQDKCDLGLLSLYLKGLSGVCGYLHRSVVVQQVTRLKQLLEQNLLKQNGGYTKEKSEMLFNGLRSLLKRVHTSEVSYEYQNSLKIRLVELSFEHEALKKKLQGLNQLKEIVKSLTFGSTRNKRIIQWVKEKKIFEKVYLVNSHVQLIKKSESFFRYIINENILQVEDLQKLFKMAQKGDYQTRISLYSLFQEVSHIFKKPHVNFLIDKILDSEPQLVLTQDIDLLHELSKFSNYFPTEKVMQFFQKLTLGQEIPEVLNSYAIKKYSDIVAKNYEMKAYRKDILKELFGKLKTHNVAKVARILKNIFEGMGFGEFGKRDLTELLQQQNFDEVILQSIRHNPQTIQECMDLLLSIYKLCSSYKIQVSTLQAIHQVITKQVIFQSQSFDKSLLPKSSDKPNQTERFFKWCNQVFACEQGIQAQSIDQLEKLFLKLFENSKTSKAHHRVVLEELELLKSIFVEVNKRKKTLSVSNTMREKEIEKEYKRKVPLKQLTFYETLFSFVFDQNQTVSQRSLEFFKNLYCSGQNSEEQISEFLEQALNLLKTNSIHHQLIQQNKITQKEKLTQSNKLSESNKNAILQSLKIIEFVIDDSQKQSSAKVPSLSSKKKTFEVKLNFINSVSYSTDTIKKMEVTIPLNFTLYDLRLHLAKQLDLPWKSVKIELNKREIPLLLNCRTIKELGLTGLQTLTVSRKVISSEPEGQIIINGQLNPKAERVFKVIFDQYSTQGKMNKVQCHDFTVKCLGSASAPKFYQDKINNLFTEYDQDKDDLLQFKDFLKFYKTAAISRASTVWSNLRSFGVQGNFKFGYEHNEEIDFDKLPRNRMSHMPQLYDLLFRLLKQKQVASAAFQLLQRLPVSKQVQEQILCINQSEFDFQSMLDTTDLYVFFYKLNIVEYLAFSGDLQSEEERDWVLRFISSQGFERIIASFFEFTEKYTTANHKDKVFLEILDILLNMVGHYLMKCFVSREILQCQLFFSTDIELSEKIEYLVTGRFSKPEITLPELPMEFEQELYCSNYTKQHVLVKTLDLLCSLWHQQFLADTSSKTDTSQSVTSPSIENESTIYLQQLLITKLMFFIPLVQLNQPFTDLTARLESFISHSHNPKLLRKFYELILCLAFHSDQGQKTIISEMFNHLSKPNIISEHFSILAVLVAKFGVQTVNEQEIVQVLMKNIFCSNNQLTIEGCSRLMLNFDLKELNEEQFDNLWQHCLFGQQKRAKKNPTRQALYQLILRASDHKPAMTNHIITSIQTQISQCVEHMRITSCTEDNQRSLAGFAGLKNLGNICYINSMLQQLYMNKNFRYLILRINDHQAENPQLYKEKLYDDNILHQVQRIFAYLQLTSRADYVPTGFCLAYKPFGESVNVMIQQDVQEFVSMLFDQLENKIKATPLRKVIDTFYGGKATNLFNCHNCNQTKKVEENFYSITLEVKNSKTLSESLNRYVSGELISDFRCDFCNQKVDVSKKTRISKAPRTLILHLQRIFFNLDTFINQKVTTRHEFPTSLDLYPYSLAEYEKPKQISAFHQQQLKDSMQYTLTGIICHIGNAESGHYISYVKIAENKWVEFNDSIVMSFSQSSIEGECFGGGVSAFVDEFEWDKSTETSKSAYILLYERQGETKIQALVKSLEEKEVFLKEYHLEEVLQKIQEQTQPQEKQPSDSQHQDQSQCSQDKLQQEIMKLQAQEKIRKKSKDINLDLEQIQEIQKELNLTQEIPLQINQDISCFIPQQLQKEILHDNEIHFFEKNLASPAFVKFFSQLLKQQHQCHQTIIKMLKNLTFGFWTKSLHFKDLLKTCTHFVQLDTKFSDEFIFNNPQIVTFLIENPDSEVRTAVAIFLASTFSTLIDKHNLTLTGQNQLDTKLLAFLDNLFVLLPNTVSKAWTKFGQYFEFWYELASRGKIQLTYMVRKQILKHFLDYYLDKKSPLQIYPNKPQIGSKYANPNFSMLLKTVTYLISQILDSKSQFKLSKDDYKILIHFECMQKLISESYQNLAVNLVRQICKNNLYASQKIAIILLKGLHKSTFNNVQPYLDVLHSYVLIQDNYQHLRVKWVLGKPTLHLSTIGKQIHAMSSYAFEERVYTYHSSISLEQASSLLDPIYELHKRAQNFAMMSLKQVLKLCLESDFVFEYIWNLPPPTLCFGSIPQFYQQFIQKYLQQAKRSYGYNQTGFNKEELGTQVKKIFDQLSFRHTLKYPPQIQKDCQQKTSSDIQLPESASAPTSEQSVPTSPEKKENKLDCAKSMFSKKKFYPVKFNFIQKQKTEVQGLQITTHDSELTFVLLEPTGKSNDSFVSGVMQKNSDKLKDDVWETAKTEIVSGFFVFNKSKNLLRIKTDDGSQLVKPTDYMWIWAKQIEKVWQCERTSDWPKWDLYSMDEQKQNCLN